MDADLVALASSGASTLITLMATDAWAQAKRSVAALFGQSRPEAGPQVEDELEESRRELIAARNRGDDQTEEELVSQWQGRLRRLLAADPHIVTAFQAVMDELGTAASQFSVQTENITIRGKATGHGRVYQQGRGVQHNR